MVQKTTEGQTGEEHLFSAHSSETRPKIPDWQVAFCKQEIDHRCKSARQKAAALQALGERDHDAYEFIVKSGKWIDATPIGHMEVGDYGDRIDRIQNQDTRERAMQALHDRDRARLERLLSEKD
jgi:hypothetical protein